MLDTVGLPCSGGVGRTGAFITVHTQLERLKTEGVVDVFQSLKSAHIQRAALVDTLLVSKTNPTYFHSIQHSQQEQYSFCYEVLAEWLDTFGMYAYANFKEVISCCLYNTRKLYLIR